MNFEEENILGLNDSEDKLSDISFAGSYSVSSSNQTSDKLHQLLTTIKGNVWGCDLILCLFVTALNTYRADKCLRPFPPSFVNEQGKNFTDLRKVCDSIPPLNSVLMELNKCPEEVVNLLKWLFLEISLPIVKIINFNNVPFPGKISNSFTPRFIFEVCYNKKCEIMWNKRKNGRDSFFAYHGSQVHNFYSILKVGLQQHFSSDKEGIFGNGIYLSNEISVSAHYSPFEQTWTNSALGSKHSIIALCEIINDIDRVKCRDPENKNRSFNTDSLGEIPEKYIVVTDSEMVRVKYLIIYREKRFSNIHSYMTQHSFVIFLILYFVLLIFVGVFSNATYVKSLRRIWDNIFC